MRGWGGVREIRLRGRALRLNYLHNTDIHTSPSPLAHDQAKEMAEVSSEMGAGLLPPHSAPASFSVVVSVHKHKLRNYYTKTYTLALSLLSHNLTLSLPFPWVVCIGHHIPMSNAFNNSYMLQPQVQADVNSHMLLWFSSASQAINLLVPLTQPASSAVTPL